jgi:hypothetical protein
MLHSISVFDKRRRDTGVNATQGFEISVGNWEWEKCSVFPTQLAEVMLVGPFIKKVGTKNWSKMIVVNRKPITSNFPV